MEPVTVPAAPQNVSFITDMVASRNARIRLTPRNATSYDITRDVVIMSDPTLLVLASLASGDKHGYAMMEDIQGFAGVRLGPGTLYGAITRLEERGWIAPVKSADDRRQPYRLSPAGRHHLEEQL